MNDLINFFGAWWSVYVECTKIGMEFWKLHWGGMVVLIMLIVISYFSANGLHDYLDMKRAEKNIVKLDDIPE